jgi:hypothetical protein
VGMLERIMVDKATVYGLDDATGRYDLPILGPFDCRLTPGTQVTLGTGVGPVRTYDMQALFPADVTLPPGYWELESSGTRYTQRVNSSSYFRDRRGNVLGRTIELDALGPAPS